MTSSAGELTLDYGHRALHDHDHDMTPTVVGRPAVSVDHMALIIPTSLCGNASRPRGWTYTLLGRIKITRQWKESELSPRVHRAEIIALAYDMNLPTNWAYFLRIPNVYLQGVTWEQRRFCPCHSDTVCVLTRRKGNSTPPVMLHSPPSPTPHPVRQGRPGQEERIPTGG